MLLKILAALVCVVAVSGQPAAPPVEVTLYYESLCPDCMYWISQQLAPALKAQGVASIMNVTLVPYGNANERQSGSSWQFTCQHGPKECLGNVIEVCAYGLDGWDFGKVWPYIFCMESSNDPVGNAQSCASKTGKNWQAINACAQGPQGNTWQHQMAVKTDALSPKHQYVPWVTINGLHNSAAEDNYLQALCQAYTGQKPPGCNRIKGCAREF